MNVPISGCRVSPRSVCATERSTAFPFGENVFLKDHADRRFRRWIFLKFREMERHAGDLVGQYAVKTPSLAAPLKNLSGGNIQKLILARELSRRPAVLVAAQPTRGVDIGASEYIHEMLLAQRDNGTAILLISEDLDEIRTLSDRIAVIYEGRIVGIVERGRRTDRRDRHSYGGRGRRTPGPQLRGNRRRGVTRAPPPPDARRSGGHLRRTVKSELGRSRWGGSRSPRYRRDGRQGDRPLRR